MLKAKKKGMKMKEITIIFRKIIKQANNKHMNRSLKFKKFN